MEEKLNGFFILPLREIVLRRIAVVLMNKPEFFLATTETFLPTAIQQSYRRTWIQTLGNKFGASVSALLLPTSLRKEIIPILKAVGSEILKWSLIHKSYIGEFDIRVVTKLSWTNTGTIDYRKTAETLLHSDVLDTMQRFELACLYCLEDCIPALWNELPYTNKKAFCDERDPSEIDTPNLELFLPYFLRKHSVQRSWPLIRFRRHCFQYSAMFGSKSATEYSFKKLLEEGINAPVLKTAVGLIKIRDPRATKGPLQLEIAARLVTLPDVLCYLLSVMTAEERLCLFMQLPCQVLGCLLDWPFQDLCLDIADVVWTFLPESEYGDLLAYIQLHIRRSGYYIPHFFRQFFLRSPMKFRKYLLGKEYQHSFFLYQFFRAEDSRSIQVIFDSIDAVDRENLVFSQTILELFDYALSTGSRSFLEEYLRKAKLSRANWDRLEEAFEKSTLNYNWRIDMEWAKKKQKRFLRFLDDLNANAA